MAGGEGAGLGVWPKDKIESSFLAKESTLELNSEVWSIWYKPLGLLEEVVDRSDERRESW